MKNPKNGPVRVKVRVRGLDVIVFRVMLMALGLRFCVLVFPRRKTMTSQQRDWSLAMLYLDEHQL